MVFDNAFIIFIVSLVGAGLGSGASIWINARIANQDRKEQKRKERVQFLNERLTELVEIYANVRLEAWSPEGGNRQLDKDARWAKVHAIMVSTNDSKIHEYAGEYIISLEKNHFIRGTEYSVELMQDTIKRLGELIASELR